MTPKEVSDALGAKYNNTKKLMFHMLGDSQLVKDDKGRYFPTNPTNPGNLGNSGNPSNVGTSSGNRSDSGNPSGNPEIPDTCGKNGGSVTEVTKVTEDIREATVPKVDENDSDLDGEYF